MRKISDTIARLSALRAHQGLMRSTPHGYDRLTALNNFGSNPGSLSAWCHIPEKLRRSAPLVVVLHGCTQTAGVYDHHSGWSRLADEAEFAVLYPEQHRSNNPNLCFNWFQPDDVARGRGEALSIHQMIKATIEIHGLDPRRVYVTGLSAGGAMAGAMLASYPEVFAGGAILSGLAFGTAITVSQAFDRLRGHGNPPPEVLQRLLRDASEHKGPWPRISIWQGDADSTVDATNASAIASQWLGVHQIARAPVHSHNTTRHHRQSWLDDSGASVLELNVIKGMGHGIDACHRFDWHLPGGLRAVDHDDCPVLVRLLGKPAEVVLLSRPVLDLAQADDRRGVVDARFQFLGVDRQPLIGPDPVYAKPRCAPRHASMDRSSMDG